MKLEWRLPRSAEVSQALLAATSSQPLVARILAGRGMTDPDEVRRFLDPAVYEPTAPATLHDLERGATRIRQAIGKGERILVWGDFDVDGQTSTALLVSALEGLGATVEYHIPIRERESHGIRPEVLRGYIDAGVDLLLTCDTGIGAVDAVALANEAGVDVVVTDHHDLPSILPEALALVNPKFHDGDHPLSGLPGVGVAYKLVEALYEEDGRGDELEAFLDLVALGIVADLAIQRGDARYLLQRGLEVLRQTERPGLLAIMAHGRVEAAFLNDEAIGFQLGPRLNAVGRLADANVSVPLLTTTDSERAREIAEQLERLNEDRKFETAVVFDSAMAQIAQEPSLLQYAVLVMANPRWHQGVIGIVASRLVEEFGKPTILFATPDGEGARGSARSVEGYHITNAIATQAEMLLGFGGHPMAAGLSLERQDLEAFRRGVSKAIIEQRGGRGPEPTLDIEAELSLAELTLETARQLEALAPFGPGNPPVNILCRGVEVAEDKQIGKEKTHRKLVVIDEVGGSGAEVLWWGGAGEQLPEGRIDVVVRMRPGFFNGQETVTISLQDSRPAGDAALGEAVQTAEIVDCRAEARPGERLAMILNRDAGAQVWGEGGGVKPEGLNPEEIRPRGEMEPGEVLVVWTAPPDRTVLAEVVARVQPERVYIFGVDPEVDEYQAFVRRLGGVVKYALAEYAGRSTLSDLAGAMGHSDAVVARGLAVLPALGVRGIRKKGEVHFERCEPAAVGTEVEGTVRGMLAEVRAFRKAFRESEDVAGFLWKSA